jgi:hypothetical protein
MAGRKLDPRPVKVRWVDAAMSADSHWSDGARPPPPKARAMHLCETVGWLVHADKEWLQIVATLAEGQHAHLTEIPRGMVRSIIALDAGKDITGRC